MSAVESLILNSGAVWNFFKPAFHIGNSNVILTEQFAHATRFVVENEAGVIHKISPGRRGGGGLSSYNANKIKPKEQY